MYKNIDKGNGIKNNKKPVQVQKKGVQEQVVRIETRKFSEECERAKKIGIEKFSDTLTEPYGSYTNYADYEETYRQLHHIKFQVFVRMLKDMNEVHPPKYFKDFESIMWKIGMQKAQWLSMMRDEKGS